MRTKETWETYHRLLLRTNKRSPLPLITEEGYEVVSRDQDISAPTLAALLRSERELIDAFGFEDVITDPMRVFDDNKLDMGDIGNTHVAMCISMNPDATFAELIADYSLDKGMPFVVSAVLISLLRSNNRLGYYTADYDGLKPWRPKRGTTVAPPAKQSKKGIDKGNVSVL